MIKILKARIQQKKRTIKFPDNNIKLPNRFRGLPSIDNSKCNNCNECVKSCPTNAISIKKGPTIDLGKCLFCTDCVNACTSKAISFSNDYKLAVTSRNDLNYYGESLKLAEKINDKSRTIFGKF